MQQMHWPLQSILKLILLLLEFGIQVLKVILKQNSLQNKCQEEVVVYWLSNLKEGKNKKEKKPKKQKAII